MSTNRLLLPVANPETADRMLETALDLARDRDLEILVLSVVPVPVQLSLEHARDQLDVSEHEETVQYVVDRVREGGVSATGRVRFGREVANGILNVAEAETVETILLGWRGRPRRRDIVLGSYIDEILSRATCDVVVERIDRSDDAVESILVPVAGGPHTEYAAEIAGALSRAHDARIELATVVSERNEEAVADARSLLDRTAPSLGAVETVEQTVLEGDVVEAILERAADHDVTVLGAAEGGFFRRVLVDEIPERIAREADSAVLMVNRYRGVSDALVRRVGNRLLARTR